MKLRIIKLMRWLNEPSQSIPRWWILTSNIIVIYWASLRIIEIIKEITNK